MTLPPASACRGSMSIMRKLHLLIISLQKPHAKSVPISTTAYQYQYEQQMLLAQAKRASTRLSTYSVTPTLTPSIAPSHLSNATNDSITEKSSPMAHDMNVVKESLSRLDEPRLTNQRYIVSDEKKEEISKLALGAKLERALGRRMDKQDAVFTKGKGKAEYVNVSVKATAA